MDLIYLIKNYKKINKVLKYNQAFVFKQNYFKTMVAIGKIPQKFNLCILMKPNIIIIDRRFFFFPKFIQDFLLLHEVGHFLNGDLKIENQYELRLEHIKNNEVIEEELIADEFAIKKLGKFKVKLALKILYLIYKNKELLLRIEKIK